MDAVGRVGPKVAGEATRSDAVSAPECARECLERGVPCAEPRVGRRRVARQLVGGALEQQAATERGGRLAQDRAETRSK